MRGTTTVPFKRMLWVGQFLYVNPWGRGSARLRGFQDLGCEVAVLDRGQVYAPIGPLMLRIENRLQWGPATSALNRLIRLGVECHQPDIVWIEKGLEFGAETVKWIQEDVGVPVAHHCTDDILFCRSHRSRHYEAAVPHYTIHFTTNPSNLRELRRRGAQAELVYNGFDHWARWYDLTEEDRRKYDADVAFIGHWEPDREETIRFLCDNDVRVRVWSHDPRWRPVHSHPKAELMGRNVYGAEYAKAICGARICLGFLSKINSDQQTGRTIEIPACGGFLLAERTELQQRYFDEGVEAEFYGDGQELLDKVRYYLSHELERASIARAALDRCRREDYSYARRLADALELVASAAKERPGSLEAEE